MHTERGFDRLVNFSDAVVAIAITLLILPLVDTVSEVAQGTTVWTVLADDWSKLLVFVISFAVIGRFWTAHHRIYEHAVDYSRWLLWANLFWLLTIVFLPFPTDLISENNNSSDGTAVLYVGTMLLTSVATAWQQAILIRHPELVAPAARGTLRIGPSVITVGMMLATLLLVIVVPGLGLSGLFLLLLTPVTQRLVGRFTRPSGESPSHEPVRLPPETPPSRP